MSVTGVFAEIGAIEHLNQQELDQGLEGRNSWHWQYKDSCYIVVTGLHNKMTEGDVVVIFSQFGHIVDINLIRDKKTGASKGFAFLCYEDQRSTILAVDNMNGFRMFGRALRVNHVDEYKVPKKFEEDEEGNRKEDEEGNWIQKDYAPTGAEGAGTKEYNITFDQKQKSKAYEDKHERENKRVAEIQKKNQDEDDRWAEMFEKKLRAEGALPKEYNDELKQLRKEEKKEAKREAKRAKKDAKKAAKKEKKRMKKEMKKAAKKKKTKKEVSTDDESHSASSKSSDMESQSPKRERRSPPKKERRRSRSRQERPRERDDRRRSRSRDQRRRSRSDSRQTKGCSRPREQRRRSRSNSRRGRERSRRSRSRSRDRRR